MTVVNHDVINASTAEAVKTADKTRINIYGAAEEGTAPFTYTYYYKRAAAKNWTLLGKENTTEQSAGFTAKTSEAYDIRTIVTDARGTSDEKVFTILDNLENVSEISSYEVVTFTPVKVFGAVEGGVGTAKYAFYYKREGARNWVAMCDEFGSATDASFRPKYEEKYFVKSVAKDERDKTAEKIFEITVRQPEPGEEIISNSTVTELIEFGDRVYMTGSAEGGTGSYTYTYEYRRSGNTKWRTIGTADTTLATASFKPIAAGTLCVRITVKDSTGNSAVKEFTVNVSE